jgi:hypothetical protein
MLARAAVLGGLREDEGHSLGDAHRLAAALALDRDPQHLLEAAGGRLDRQ